MNRSVISVAVMLAGLGAVYGWQLGRGVVPLDESAAITAVVAHHLDHVPDARATDCAATPGEGAVWLVVRCHMPATTQPEAPHAERVQAHDTVGQTDGLIRYRLDRRGKLIFDRENLI